MSTATEDKPRDLEALGTGRRKTSIARVRVRPGDGKILVNKRPIEEYFTIEKDRNAVMAPLDYCEVRSNVDVLIRVHGGGNTGQAGVRSPDSTGPVAVRSSPSVDVAGQPRCWSRPSCPPSFAPAPRRCNRA